MERFCPKCGKSINQESMLNNFCIDCYLSENQIIKVPDLEITFCVKCFKIKMKNKWYGNLEDLEEDISKNVKYLKINQPKIKTKVNLDLENNIHNAEITVKTIVGTKFKELKFIENINVKKDTCISCSRIAGNYYTTILQIRFNDKKLQELIFQKIVKEVKDIVSSINEKTSRPSANINIIKEINQKNGIDFYFDNLRFTRNIVTHLMKHKSAFDTKKSSTLVGVDKTGKELVRNTFCVHFGKKE